MRIFFASQSFYPNIGGVSTYLLNLAKGLMQRGNEVIEVHLRPPNEKSEDIIKDIKVYRIPREPLNERLLQGYSNFKERIYRECHGEGELFHKEPLVTYGYEDYQAINDSLGKQIEELLEKHPSEIVHIHDFQLLLIYRNIPRGIPVILTWHIPFLPSISPHLKEFLIKHMREFDKVIFSCKEYADAAIASGFPKERAEIIPPLANTSLFRPRAQSPTIKNKIGMMPDAKLLLCVQRIDSKSGHSQLIRAFKEIALKFPTSKLVFVGGDSLTSKISTEREKYVQQVHQLIDELSLGEKVIFTGNVPYEDLPSYYNAADVVALTSKNEGFGLALTEAMACARPVIGTKVPGIMSQITDGRNGFLVDVGDHGATAEKISELFSNNELRARMGGESLAIIKERFEMVKGVDRHHRLYNRLLKTKSDWRLECLKLDDVSAIITDFDRTLADTPGVVDALIIKELRSLGKPLILATGREEHFVKKLAKRFPIWDCIVGENGCFLYFPKRSETWHLGSEAQKQAQRILREASFGANMGKVVISFQRSKEKEAEELLSSIRGNLSFIPNVDEIMVLPNGINKGTSVKLALQSLGIDQKKSIVIGDGENDVDLFSNPGFKVAVANATERLKLLADEVTEKPASAGIMEILGKLRM